MKPSITLLLALVLCAGLMHAAEKDDEVAIKRNAAEQAAALNQDPGGADRNALLAARAKDKIEAGLPGERTSHPDAQWFGNASLGLFLHWSISSAHGGIDLSWPMITNMGSGLKLKPADYWKLADKFKAEHYDPNLWLKAAKEAGFDYAVLTTKHHDGFPLWPTEASEIGVRTSLPGRDLVQEYVAACRTNGLKVGFYYSGPDWFKAREYMTFNYRSESGGNSSLPPIAGRPDLDMNWQPTKLKPMPADVRARIQQECRQELTELLTRYGKIDVLWFDGGTGSDMTLEEIRKLQPGIVINNRGGMAETKGGPKFAGDYFTVEHGDQPFRPPGWWEQLRIWNSPTWGYMKQNDKTYTSTASILKSLARSKAWGGSVMANCGPRPDGTMPPPFYQGMTEVRDWMKVNGESIKGASPMPEIAQANVPVTTRGDTWYLHAVNGCKGKLSAKPGIAVPAIKSARILRTGKPVNYLWADGLLEIEFPEPDRNTPHEVIAVTFQRSGGTSQSSLLPGGTNKWELIWSDEFDGPDSDLEVAWESQNGPSGHILSSRWRENVVVSNGLCRLLNKKEPRAGQAWTSGSLWTKRQFKYGYFECRYRYGAATGLNNSFWLMDKLPKGAPGKFEIDINEGHYTNEVAMNIHRWSGEHIANSKTWIATGKNLADEFHTYGLLWTELELVWYFDGREIRRETNSFCHGEAPVMLSSAVIKWAGKVTDKIDGTAMEVDYVRVYQTDPNLQSAAIEYNFADMLQPVPVTAKWIDPVYNIWCGSAVKGDDGKYHMFYSRWPRKLTHQAWVTHSEIAHAVSDSPFGPWTHHDVALPARGTNYWDGSCTHNPTVIRWNGKYYLYYMGNYGDGVVEHPLNWTHRNHQRIGVAVADNPNGPWQRFDQPVMDVSADTNAPDALMVANPSVAVRPDGGVLMVYKAVAKHGQPPFGGPVSHLVATAESPTGPFTKHPGEVFGAKGVMFAAEDPFIWRGADRYWAVVKDNDGNFTHRGYSLALWESADGMDWKLSKHPFVANPGLIRWADGHEEQLTTLERPQVVFENGEPIALCCAAANNKSRDGSFNVQIPLKVAK